MDDYPQRIVVMGVTASGKTSVGRAMAERLGFAFCDSDELHPPENVAKMSRGEPLNDADRAPWLARVGRRLAEAGSHGDGVVVACSALKRDYREQILAEAPDAVFVVLHGDRTLLGERMNGRSDHFMPVSLLDSQLETLEMPEGDEPAVTVGVQPSIETIVQRAIARVGTLFDGRVAPAPSAALAQDVR